MVMFSRWGRRSDRKRRGCGKNRILEMVWFHFLEDQEVIEKLQGKHFRVMFILRGLPGSGKSWLTNKIVNLYPKSIVCSSDHFLTEDNIYNWSPEKQEFGHSYCSQLASKCCEMKCPIVVIDNTNIERKDIQIYIDIASKNGYITIIVNPKTPWRFDPRQLVKRTSHHVPLHILKYKLSVYQEIMPNFCAWFLGHEDAKRIFGMASDMFLKSLRKIPELSLHLSTMHATETDYDPNQHYGSSEPVLCYCIANSHFRNTNFYRTTSIRESIGKIFQLRVSAFLQTPCSLSALVALSTDQLQIYEEESVLGNISEDQEEETEEEDELGKGREKDEVPSIKLYQVGRKGNEKDKKCKSQQDLSENSKAMLTKAVEEKLELVLSMVTLGEGFNQPKKENLRKEKCGAGSNVERSMGTKLWKYVFEKYVRGRHMESASVGVTGKQVEKRGSSSSSVESTSGHATRKQVVEKSGSSSTVESTSGHATGKQVVEKSGSSSSSVESTSGHATGKQVVEKSGSSSSVEKRSSSSSVESTSGHATRKQVVEKRGSSSSTVDATRKQVVEKCGSSSNNNVESTSVDATGKQVVEKCGSSSNNNVESTSGDATRKQVVEKRGSSSNNNVESTSVDATRKQVVEKRGSSSSTVESTSVDATRKQVVEKCGSSSNNNVESTSGDATGKQVVEKCGSSSNNNVESTSGDATRKQVVEKRGSSSSTVESTSVDATRKQVVEKCGSSSNNNVESTSGDATGKQVVEKHGSSSSTVESTSVDATRKQVVEEGEGGCGSNVENKSMSATKGECAHILLASRDKVDFTNISKEIKKVSKLKEVKGGDLKSFWKFSNDHVEVFYLGEGTCLMNLKEDIYLNTIYAYQY